MALACDNCGKVVRQTNPSPRWLRVETFTPTDVESTTFEDLALLVEGVFCTAECLRAYLTQQPAVTRRLEAPPDGR